MNAYTKKIVLAFAVSSSLLFGFSSGQNCWVKTPISVDRPLPNGYSLEGSDRCLALNPPADAEALYISGIKNISRDCFANLTMLKLVELWDTSIEALPANLFTGASSNSIAELRFLSNSLLKNVSDGLFADLNSLLSVAFEYNPLLVKCRKICSRILQALRILNSVIIES
jgi:hypothetical protein